MSEPKHVSLNRDASIRIAEAITEAIVATTTDTDTFADVIGGLGAVLATVISDSEVDKAQQEDLLLVLVSSVRTTLAMIDEEAHKGPVMLS
jgi:hypothetical protein